jgi:MmeI, C-terminal domain
MTNNKKSVKTPFRRRRRGGTQNISISESGHPARAKYPDSSLADLYDPLTMPPELVRSHQGLDKCYRGPAFGSETERLEYLFGLYNEYVEPMIVNKKTKKGRRSKRI